MHIRLRVFLVFVVLCVGSGLVMGWSLTQGVVPIVCKIYFFRIKSEIQQARHPSPSKYNEKQGVNRGIKQTNLFPLLLACSSFLFYTQVLIFRTSINLSGYTAAHTRNGTLINSDCDNLRPHTVHSSFQLNILSLRPSLNLSWHCGLAQAGTWDIQKTTVLFADHSGHAV
jgi:hypothetical protein